MNYRTSFQVKDGTLKHCNSLGTTCAVTACKSYHIGSFKACEMHLGNRKKRSRRLCEEDDDSCAGTNTCAERNPKQLSVDAVGRVVAVKTKHTCAG